MLWSGAELVLRGEDDFPVGAGLPLLAPLFPNEIDETVMEIEDRIIGRGGGVEHVSPDEDMDISVGIFEAVEVGTIGTAGTGSGVGQDLVDFRLGHYEVDVGLIEELTLFADFSLNVSSSLKQGKISFWVRERKTDSTVQFQSKSSQ